MFPERFTKPMTYYMPSTDTWGDAAITPDAWRPCFSSRPRLLVLRRPSCLPGRPRGVTGTVIRRFVQSFGVLAGSWALYRSTARAAGFSPTRHLPRLFEHQPHCRAHRQCKPARGRIFKLRAAADGMTERTQSEQRIVDRGPGTHRPASFAVIAGQPRHSRVSKSLNVRVGQLHRKRRSTSFRLCPAQAGTAIPPARLRPPLSRR